MVLSLPPREMTKACFEPGVIFLLTARYCSWLMSS
jgi:hypothetical protein